MPEIRGRQLEVIDGPLNQDVAAGLKHGQLAIVDSITDPKDKVVDEVFALHLASQQKNGLSVNDPFPTHYSLTLQNDEVNAQIEPFLPVFQKVKDAPAFTQITGRILDFTVFNKTPDRSDDPGRINYAIADTAHVPAIVKLRQIVDDAKKLGYVSQYEDLIQHNGDVFCVWEVAADVGTMVLKSVLSTTEVSPIDYLEIDAVPDIPSFDKEFKKPEDLTYNYTSSFTDLESYEDENLKKLIEPILKGLKNPNNSYSTAFLDHVTAKIFNPNHKIDAKYDKAYDAVMSLLNNANHHNNPVAPLATLAHSIVRAHLLLKTIQKQERAVTSGKLKRKGIPGEPTFTERREKVWFELAHAFGFEHRVHAQHAAFTKFAKFAKEQNVDVYSPLRAQFRSYDDIDARIVAKAKKSLAEFGEASLQAALLKSFLTTDFNGQRSATTNFVLLGLPGTQFRVASNVHKSAPLSKEPTGLIAISSDQGTYNVVTPPYYPTSVINAFQSNESPETFINTIPGVLALFKVLIPEIDGGKDSRPDLANSSLNREYVVTSAKYQPWAVTEFILQKMYGNKEKYHQLRQAIKNKNITWQGIMEQPRIQSWTLLADNPIVATDPLSRRDTVAIGKPLYNGDAFLIATDDASNTYFDKGKIKGQNPRHRKVGVIAKKGFFVNDKKISRPVYTHAQSSDKHRHQLEVIFAGNAVYANDIATGAADRVVARAPEQTKVIIRKQRKRIIV